MDKYNPARKFSTWAYTIVLNATRNHLRRKALVRFLSLDYTAADDENEAPIIEPADPQSGPARSFEDQAFSECFRLAVLKLPLNLKDVFVLFYFHEMTVADIASMQGVSENAIKLRLMRARELLRKEVGSKYPEMFSDRMLNIGEMHHE